MIGFNALGQLGRLGNQMFQFAALKGIAANNGYQYCIPYSKNQNQYKDHQLFEPFKLSNTNQLNIQLLDFSRPTIYENSFCFDGKLFNNCPEWVNLQGYFQSEKYFKNIKKEIRKDFEFIDDFLIPCQESISKIDNPTALHIRRTDYITNPNHNVLDIDYYHRALKLFNNDQQVIIFSDDPKWCKKQELFESDRFLISEGQSNYMDMCLMTLCSGHIIANSSFSWWGAWLAKSEKVIAPIDWFKGSNNENLNIKDLFPETWSVI